MSSPYRDENGLVGSLPPDTAAMRVMLRPLGSPLPLGASALVPAGMVLSGLPRRRHALEESMHRSVLPIGRRGLARAAFEEGLHAQMGELQHEAGVRNQL